MEINDITTQQVSAKLKGSFKRIKGMWEDKNKAIKKIEKKSNSLTEELYILKEERKNLEDELEGIRETYQRFCEETGIVLDLA